MGARAYALKEIKLTLNDNTTNTKYMVIDKEWDKWDALSQEGAMVHMLS